jgi:protein SCO1/2
MPSRVKGFYTFFAIFTTFCCSILPSGLFSGVSQPPLAVFEKVGGRVPLDLEVFTEDGKKVLLGDLLRGTPAILALVYYRCPGTCNLILNGLAESLQSLNRYRIGQDYRIITFSFDPRDTPEIASLKKKSYLNRFPLPGDPENGWFFLSASTWSIERITEATGYPIFWTEGEYVHPSLLIFLSPEGESRRYLYGLSYDPKDVLLALFESGMTPRTLTDSFKKLIFSYRKDLQAYTLSPLWVRGFAFAGLGIVILLFLYGLRLYRTLPSPPR